MLMVGKKYKNRKKEIIIALKQHLLKFQCILKNISEIFKSLLLFYLIYYKRFERLSFDDAQFA